jgi:hypothetical protein
MPSFDCWRGTMWAVSVMADSGTAVAESSSGPEWWTLAAGLVGGLVTRQVRE